MPRTLGDVGFPTDISWPNPGKHVCVCREASLWTSPRKGTPAINLVWDTADGEHRFDDKVFLTPGALQRAVMVAARVCGMPETAELPDDDDDALDALKAYIMDKAPGKAARVTVELQEVEDFNTETGRTETKRFRRVAFAGYDVAGPLDTLGKRVDDMGSDLPPLSDDEQPATDNDLPF